MARVETVAHVEASPQVVWDELVEWEAQPTWMHDAKSVTVRDGQRTGAGTTLAYRTRIALGVEIGGELTVTEWEPPTLLAIRHDGAVIRGVGAFELAATAHGARVLWWEEFEAPLGVLGEALATVLVVPFVRRVFRRSMAALKRRAEHAPQA